MEYGDPNLFSAFFYKFLSIITTIKATSPIVKNRLFFDTLSGQSTNLYLDITDHTNMTLRSGARVEPV